MRLLSPRLCLGIREGNLELIADQISTLACSKWVTPSWQVTHLQYLDEGMVPNNTAYQSTNASLAHNSCTYQHLSLQLWQINPTHAGNFRHLMAFLTIPWDAVS